MRWRFENPELVRFKVLIERWEGKISPIDDGKIQEYTPKIDFLGRQSLSRVDLVTGEEQDFPLC